MKNRRPEEENIIKDIRNLFKLKKELNYTSLKDICTLFRLEKETKGNEDRILKVYLSEFLDISLYHFQYTIFDYTSEPNMVEAGVKFRIM